MFASVSGRDNHDNHRSSPLLQIPIGFSPFLYTHRSFHFFIPYGNVKLPRFFIYFLFIFPLIFVEFYSMFRIVVQILVTDGVKISVIFEAFENIAKNLAAVHGLY